MQFLGASAHERVLPVDYPPATCWIPAAPRCGSHPQKVMRITDSNEDRPCMAVSGPPVHPSHPPSGVFFGRLRCCNHVFHYFFEKCFPPPAGSTFLQAIPMHLGSKNDISSLQTGTRELLRPPFSSHTAPWSRRVAIFSRHAPSRNHQNPIQNPPSPAETTIILSKITKI